VSSSANIPGEADPEDFYDSSPLEPTQLYQGKRLGFEFRRTVSRLIEMQSEEYLARAHARAGLS